jgi:hypothetical protein
MGRFLITNRVSLKPIVLRCSRQDGLSGSTRALEIGEWLTSRPGRITPGIYLRCPLKRRLEGRRVGLDVLGEDRNLGIRTPDRPARSLVAT